jgi:hypothetical protein
MARSARSGALVLVMVVALAGCASANVTPIIVHVTPAPTAADFATPTEAPTDTAAPTATATEAPTDTPTPTAAPSTLASACTGTADHRAFFAEAASLLSFDVYCAALPSNWWLQATQYQQPEGGQLTITYKNLSGQIIEVGEGNFCSSDPSCWVSTSDLGTASFGALPGSLKLRTAGPVYAVYVSPGTANGYSVAGQGMSQSDFVVLAAMMVKVPKP